MSLRALPRVWGQPTVTYATGDFGGSDSDVGNTETTLADIAFVRSTSQPTAKGDVVNSEKARGVAIKVKVNSLGTTDDFDVNLYTSDDGVEFDTVALSESFSMVATGGGDVIKTITLEAPARHLRVRGQSDGATDDFDVEVTIVPFQHGECMI